MNFKQVPMSRLRVGEKGKIIFLEATGSLRRRMQDLGFYDGTVVESLHRSPSGDPAAYSVRGTVIALRDEDAKKIILTVPV
ncbi:MAG: FeoA family protein [Bacillota bacterium]|nr:FeoA family protein [Bacillota bacterium]